MCFAALVSSSARCKRKDFHRFIGFRFLQLTNTVCARETQSHAGKHKLVPTKWKVCDGKCMSGLWALIIFELEWFGHCPLALKREKISGSISSFMKATLPGTHGTTTKTTRGRRRTETSLFSLSKSHIREHVRARSIAMCLKGNWIWEDIRSYYARVCEDTCSLTRTAFFSLSLFLSNFNFFLFLYVSSTLFLLTYLSLYLSFSREY